MPPSEERMHDDPSDHKRLITTLLNEDTGMKVDDDEEEEDDSSILLIDDNSSHGSGNSRVSGSYYVSNLGSSENNHISMLSEGFASHDSITFDQQQLLSSSENDDDDEEVTSSNGDIHTNHNDRANDNHRIVLYYNSNTVSSTKTLSLMDVRNRLMKNLQFIKDVKKRLGPFLDANSKYFTMEYCDVADRETSRMLQKQFGSNDAEGDDDGATVVTTSSLMVSLPAIVIDHRIMIPCSEHDWAAIVMDYMNLLLNLVHATELDDTSLASRVSLRHEIDCTDQKMQEIDVSEDNELYDDELNEYDLSLHIENSKNGSSDEDDSERYNDYYAMEQYYKEAPASISDLMGRNIATSNTTNSCSTTNDSAESSVTQVTTNLTRRTTSSSRLQSLLEPFNNSSNDISLHKEDSRRDQKKAKAVDSSSCIPPTATIQFPSDDDPDVCDHTSFSTLSYTVSNELPRVEVVRAVSSSHVPMALSPVSKPSEIPQTTKEAVNSATRIVAAVVHQPGQRLLTVPLTKQTITVVEITRQLMNVTTHRYQYIPQSSSAKWQNSFRGFEGIIIWKNLFGRQSMNSIKIKGNCPDTGDDDKWIEFGLLLLSYGILHDYTPHEKDFRRAYLAVQPSRNKFALNTLLQWVPSKHEDKSNVDYETGQTSKSDIALCTVLRLSRSMDAIVERYSSNPSSSNHLLDEYEEAVCQLQVLPLPSDTMSKMVVALNLYNMIVRHAMFLTLNKKRKEWNWPTSLEEMDLLFDKIGYIIAGTFMSASNLREYLFCGVDRFDGKEYANSRKIISPRNGTRPGSSCMTSRRGVKGSSSFAANMVGTNCMGGGATNRWKKGLGEENDHYEAKRVETDKRLLMGLTWGTTCSPVFHTVYPEQFDKTLDEHAERYCQKHVTITEDTSSPSCKVVTVTLPSLFSWYRNDFGTYRENMLESIQQYLSTTTRDKIIEAQRLGKLRITFEAASAVNWTCRFPESEFLKGGDGYQLHSVRSKAAVPPDAMLKVATQCAVNPSQQIIDSSRTNMGNSGYSKEMEFPKEKAPSSIQNVLSVQDITPGKRKYKKPSPLIHVSRDSSEIINDAKCTFSKEGCAASSALTPDIYLAHLNVTRNLLGEMGMEHVLCPSQKEISHEDGNRLSPTRSANASRDIVINGLNHPISTSSSAVVPGKYKHVDYNKKGEPKENSKKTQHDIQTGLFPDEFNYPMLKRSTNDIADQLFGQVSEQSKDKLALIQQWIGFKENEPSSARLARQGDSVLIQTIQAPSNARQTSLGDSILLPPIGRTKVSPRATSSALKPDATKVEYFLPTENSNPNIEYDANPRFDENGTEGSFTFRSDVSAITFGSEFDALLRANSLQQLVHPATQSPTAAMHHPIKKLLHLPMTTSSPTGAACGQLTYPQLQQQ